MILTDFYQSNQMDAPEINGLESELYPILQFRDIAISEYSLENFSDGINFKLPCNL